MMVRVQLFARARDLAGAGSITVDLPEKATVADLRRHVAGARPALRTLLERCAVAVDNEFADDSHPLHAEANIALLPPVSGG